MADVQLCNHPGCDAPATQAYAWEWGEKGVTCPTHVTHLNQTAAATKRKVTLAPLQEAPTPPMTRDERTRLKAEVYTLEEELSDAKEQGAKLYAERNDLAAQLRRALARETELKTKLADVEADLAKVNDELDDKTASLQEAVSELTTLRGIVGDTAPA